MNTELFRVVVALCVRLLSMLRMLTKNTLMKLVTIGLGGLMGPALVIFRSRCIWVLDYVTRLGLSLACLIVCLTLV